MARRPAKLALGAVIAAGFIAYYVTLETSCATTSQHGDGGELVIVGNRHLDYQDKLERIFGNCELVTENKKFVILRAVKED